MAARISYDEVRAYLWATWLIVNRTGHVRMHSRDRRRCPLFVERCEAVMLSRVTTVAAFSVAPSRARADAYCPLRRHRVRRPGSKLVQLKPCHEAREAVDFDRASRDVDWRLRCPFAKLCRAPLAQAASYFQSYEALVARSDSAAVCPFIFRQRCLAEKNLSMAWTADRLRVAILQLATRVNSETALRSI
jgi:hypothetical protein